MENNKTETLERPIVFFDLETTGLSVTDDRIIQIACIKIGADGVEIARKSTLVKTDKMISKEASEVHGIFNKDLEGSPTFKQISKGIFDFFEGCDIGTYNGNSFDVPFIVEEFKRAGLDFDTSGRNYLDGLAIEKELTPRNLSAVYEKYTHKNLENAHDALADVEATIEIVNAQRNLLGLNTSEEVDRFSQGENERVDLAGKLCLIDGVVCFNFGKYNGIPVLHIWSKDSNYVNWVMSVSPSETNNLIIKERN